MADPTKPGSGELLVGITEDGQNIVINHPDLQPDAEGCGHIVFSPMEAVNLAVILMKKSQVARGLVCGHCGDVITQDGGHAKARFTYCFKDECQQEFYKEAQAMIRMVDPATADRLAAATNSPDANAERQRELDAGEAISFKVNPDILNVVAAQPSFTCPKCGAVSYNPNDVENRYCGACHLFFGEWEKGLNR
jgi:ribosomal protein S27AE